MAVCQNCGNNVADGVMFCTRCGSKIQPPVGAYTGYSGGGGYYQNTSDWDGSVLETLGATLVYSLLITFTCGIAVPWAICYLYNFIISHTRIDGKRLRFDGNGASLFGNWIVWMILTTITCGIYGFWVAPKMYKWFASHTHFDN